MRTAANQPRAEGRVDEAGSPTPCCGGEPQHARTHLADYPVTGVVQNLWFGVCLFRKSTGVGRWSYLFRSRSRISPRIS